LILVISNIANDAAPALVDMFPPGAAFLITASTFHQTVKAAVSVNNFSRSLFTVNNKNITADDIKGIITTVPCFLPQEFYYIEPADRGYICAEMNAFFIYFLSQLDCKKLNPSSRSTLTGLSMHKIELIKILSALKIPLWKVHFKNGVYIEQENGVSYKFFKATIVGNTIIPHTLPEKIIQYMKAISDHFMLPYIRAHFISPDEKGFFLLDMLTVPDLGDDGIRHAITSYFKPALL
jgi:hypothetical protein